MIIQLHTPKGIIPVDTDKVTDRELAELHVTRESLSKLVPRDLAAELDGLKAALVKKGILT